MKLTKDEEMLVLLYGDGTREGLQKALMEMQKTLQADETELREKRLWKCRRPCRQMKQS